jgi:WD repeat-containing protein 19
MDMAGQLKAVTSPTYNHNDDSKDKKKKERQLLKFTQNLALLRLKEAWNAALNLNKPRYWHALANKAMQVMDIEMAIRVYRQVGDAGMVIGLEKLRFLEDKVRSILESAGSFRGANRILNNKALTYPPPLPRTFSLAI